MDFELAPIQMQMSKPSFISTGNGSAMVFDNERQTYVLLSQSEALALAMHHTSRVRWGTYAARTLMGVGIVSIFGMMAITGLYVRQNLLAPSPAIPTQLVSSERTPATSVALALAPTLSIEPTKLERKPEPAPAVVAPAVAPLAKATPAPAPTVAPVAAPVVAAAASSPTAALAKEAPVAATAKPAKAPPVTAPVVKAKVEPVMPKVVAPAPKPTAVAQTKPALTQPAAVETSPTVSQHNPQAAAVIARAPSAAPLQRGWAMRVESNGVVYFDGSNSKLYRVGESLPNGERVVDVDDVSATYATDKGVRQIRSSQLPSTTKGNSP